jgi:CheY-like chemotaxis protein
MQPARRILLVESDAECGRALAALLERAGNKVRLVKDRAEALVATRRRRYDLAVVDLFLPGGGPELARRLARRVPRLYLSLGARLATEEILQAVLGFPLLHKAALPRGITDPDASSNGTGSGVKRRGSSLPRPAASVPARGHAGRARRRSLRQTA